MKYDNINSECPIPLEVIQLGKLLEGELQHMSIHNSYTYVAIDSNSVVNLFQEEPDRDYECIRYDDPGWSPGTAGLVSLTKIIPFTPTEDEYISHNWDNLIFKLGPR